jgi:hypothetical protein
MRVWEAETDKSEAEKIKDKAQVRYRLARPAPTRRRLRTPPGQLRLSGSLRHACVCGTNVLRVACRWGPTQAEFDAEQEYLKTLSYLSPEEQRKYKCVRVAVCMCVGVH